MVSIKTRFLVIMTVRISSMQITSEKHQYSCLSLCELFVDLKITQIEWIPTISNKQKQLI